MTLSIVDFLNTVREDSGARFIILVFLLFTVFALLVVRNRRT